MKTIAIIGTGISGMGAAYFLRGKYDITFYEQNDYVGGHTNTLTIDEDGKPVRLDSAFMVYNETTYPLLTRLFKELKVETKATNMSFSVQHVPSGLEFCGTGYNGLFAQRQNVLNVPFIHMLFEIDRFKREADEVLDDAKFIDYSIARYAQERTYGDDFIQKFLLPMSSAVWSTPAEAMLEFPIVTLVRFFKNHCFLGVDGHLQWRTCVGGSHQYRDKLLSQVNAKMWTNRGAVQVMRGDGGVKVLDSTGIETAYDHVIMACHGDEVLPLLHKPTALETKLLSQFLYHDNLTTLHSDERVMPKTKRAWSSWNYRIQKDAQGRLATTTIYDMNSLQGVSTKKNYFISLNDPGIIDPKLVMWQTKYKHPIYNVHSQEAQKELPRLNQDGPVFFCGAYFRYGFHEDGLMSGLDAARALTGEAIWK